MAIPSRQIGWGTEENLLWQISKQLEYLTKVVGNLAAANEVIAYSDVLQFPISYASLRLNCNGEDVEYYYTNQTVNNMSELVNLFNNDDPSEIGTYSDAGENILKLTTTAEIKNQYCPSGTLSLNVFSD